MALSAVAEEFLRARIARKAKHRPEAVHAIVGLAACLGDLPIGRVTPSDVEAALRHSHPLPGVRKRLVPHLKDFFRWARTRGYLPADRPFPAGTLNVRVPRTQPPILSLPQVKALLSGTDNVELCLASALILLSGIRAAELEQLSWETVTPGFCIEVPWKRSWPGRTRPRWVFKGLDGWLRPFYGCHGPVVSPRTLRLRLRPFSRRPGLRIKPGDLRHTFQAYNLGFAGSLGRVARRDGSNLGPAPAPSLPARHRIPSRQVLRPHARVDRGDRLAAARRPTPQGPPAAARCGRARWNPQPRLTKTWPNTSTT